jgi:hypothetical protein
MTYPQSKLGPQRVFNLGGFNIGSPVSIAVGLRCRRHVDHLTSVSRRLRDVDDANDHARRLRRCIWATDRFRVNLLKRLDRVHSRPCCCQRRGFQRGDECFAVVRRHAIPRCTTNFFPGVDRERKNGMVGAEPPGNGSRACEAVRAVQGGDSLRHTPLNFLGKRAFRHCYPLLNPQALIQSASFDGTVRSGVTSIGGATVCSIMVP